MAARVLLVEDSRNMHVMMTDLFASVGHLELRGVANTEAEALYWLEEHVGQWDLTIVDLVLAQGSGINVVARAKGTHPGGVVVVFSGYASSGVSDHLKRLGASEVFDKADSQAFIAWLAQYASKVDGATIPSHST
jgi:DNA-binding NtrC family response regulator